MHDFFNGWRRKVGVATLVMACVFTAGWVRSYSPNNGFVFCGEWLESSRPGIVESVVNAIHVPSGECTRIVCWTISYPIVVLPLTLLSASLLLSKRPPDKRVEAAHVEGIA